ncbi:MAG TPA: hypothetical protein VLZ75_00285 [Chitinophagales bacterium]|nr:hypothetical protein [Chitinophagales bacterium]
MDLEKEEVLEKEVVPVFRSWNGWYLFLVALLVLEVVFFYLLTLGLNE